MKVETLTLHRKKFTREIYYKMAELGLFQEDNPKEICYTKRLELIKGEIFEMSPVGFKHASCVKKLNYLLMKKLSDKVILGVQDPIKLKDNTEPQPDLVLLKPRPDFYIREHPQPEDIFLLIEVADSSINYDREVKLPLYAENKIHEVWLIDLNKKILEVHQNPYNNYYQNIQKLSSINNVCLSNFTDIEIKVSDLFD